MAWGGGTFVTQNKTLAGAYINFVSAARANANLSDRGFAAMPLVLDWGVDGEDFTVTNEDFILNCQKIFGYDYSHEKLKGLRDVFKNCQTLYVYRLNSDSVKASNTFATAKYSGVRGNDLKTVISFNVDDESKYDVKTVLGTVAVDLQTVSAASELVDNDYCTFKTSAVLSETASTPFTGGTNGEAVGSTGGQWQKALEALESYSFNVIGVVSTDDAIKSLVKAWTVRLRDEMGVKFQAVMYKYAADDKAVISVENKIVGETSESGNLVYWVTGAECACKVNASLTNRAYDGEFEVDVKFTQNELVEAIKAGKFTFHRVGDGVRVLSDINTKVSVSDEENEDFKSNQTVRVIDQIGNDVATLWNERYNGIIPNDEAGRISFWNDVVKHHQELQTLRAIENFEPEDVVVTKGNGKKDVVVSDAVTVVNCMEKLYMTCVIA